MPSEHEHHGEHRAHAHHGPRALPASLGAPEVLAAWRMRSLIVAVVFAVLTFVCFSWTHEGRNHIIRAYLMGYMTCFNFAGGALVMLMLQYVTGGKWGLLLRRPLEAMTRTLPLVALMFIPVVVFGKHLYQWMLYPTAASTNDALLAHLITKEQALTADFKRPMLSPSAMIWEAVIIFAILLLFMYLLNKWSLDRDADPLSGTGPSFERWRTRFENLCGPGILIYVILLTLAAIVWIKSLDVTWYSSIWGLQFLVAQGYAVLALGILSVILLSRHEPMKTLLRQTEQHDLGKLAFAFVMLNIYLCFAEFLIIWSGNIPDELPWYLNRIHGGWWMICTLDFCAHWLIPFCLLLSRDLKRNKNKMIWLACWMIFARLVDMFWLIEPNFRDSAGNLHLAHNLGMLAYITVPISMLGFWGAYYIHQLMGRPLVNVNDPHLEEIWSPSMHTEGDGMNDGMNKDAMHNADHKQKIDAEHPGYETTDVNVKGVVVFLAGLSGFVVIFFFFCFGMGRAINNLWIKQDGPVSKWKSAGNGSGRLENLTSDAAMEQKQLQQMTANFPLPRLVIDNGEQDTADLHAREDLLLNHYSFVDGQPGTIRIPIDRAMELIAQRGLPVEKSTATAPLLAHDAKPVIQEPLTDGFARTGYELTAIEEREQKMEYGKAEAVEK